MLMKKISPLNFGSLKHYGFLFLVMLLVGCTTKGGYELAEPGALPSTMPDWNISESPVLQELSRTYNSGTSHERAKINYLLAHTKLSPYSFDRNGHIYDGDTTAQHLRRKYRKVVKKVKTAVKLYIYIIHDMTIQLPSQFDKPIPVELTVAF